VRSRTRHPNRCLGGMGLRQFAVLVLLLHVASPRSCACPCPWAFAVRPAGSVRPPLLLRASRPAVAMGLSKAQRRSVDTALDRLNRRQQTPQSPRHWEGVEAEVVTDAHVMLAEERRVKLNWDSLPGRLDPHTMTWRGSSLGGPGCGVNTTSHDSIKKTVNPRSARKRAQVTTHVCSGPCNCLSDIARDIRWRILPRCSPQRRPRRAVA